MSRAGSVKMHDGAQALTFQGFQEQTGGKHAFQVAMDEPYVDRDCFSELGPIVVPARTFLSQLV